MFTYLSKRTVQSSATRTNSRCRKFISPNAKGFVVNVLFREVERSNFSSVEVKPLLTKYSPYSAVYKFAQGLTYCLTKNKGKLSILTLRVSVRLTILLLVLIFFM